MHTAIPLTVLATALACSLATAPAHARARVFVASYGTDSATCGPFGSPCRNFQQAVNNVDPGGEVTAIDSAGFGPISINKAVSITSPNGVEAGIVSSAGGTAITINAPTDAAVSLQGLTIDGTGGATTGIQFLVGGSLTIRNSVIRNFSADGVDLTPNVVSTIAISDTLVANNGGHGIFLQSLGNADGVFAVFNRVEAYNNAQSGIGVLGNMNNLQTSATATNCVAAHNLIGYKATGSGPAGVTAFAITRSTAFNNSIGVFSENYARLIISENDLHGNAETPWNTSSGGLMYSYGDNLTEGGILPGISEVSKH